MARLIQRGRHHLVGTSQEWLRWLSILFLVSNQSEDMENRRGQDNIVMVPEWFKQWKQCDRWKQCKQCKQCRLDSGNSESTNSIWSVTNLFIYQTQVRSLPCLFIPSVRHYFRWILFRWVLWIWWARWVSWTCWVLGMGSLLGLLGLFGMGCQVGLVLGTFFAIWSDPKVFSNGNIIFHDPKKIGGSPSLW